MHCELMFAVLEHVFTRFELMFNVCEYHFQSVRHSVS